MAWKLVVRALVGTADFFPSTSPYWGFLLNYYPVTSTPSSLKFVEGAEGHILRARADGGEGTVWKGEGSYC